MIKVEINRKVVLTGTLRGGAGARLLPAMDSPEVSDMHDLEALRPHLASARIWSGVRRFPLKRCTSICTRKP